MADLTRKTANLFNYQTMGGTIKGYYLDSEGELQPSSTAAVTDYIPCSGGSFTLDKVGGISPSICLYDENKQFLYGKAYNTSSGSDKQTIIVDTSFNASFIRFTYFYTGAPMDDLSTIMLNEGSTALPYEPYGWQHSLRKLGNSTDTITTLPADIYADGTNASVSLKGNMYQASGVSPDTPIQPQETGERTRNLFDITAFVQGISPNRCTTSYDGTTNTLTINATGNDAHTGNTNSYHIPVTGGETYTLSWGTNAVSGQMYIFENGLTDSSHLHDWNSSLRQISITMRSDTTFIIVRLGCNVANTVKTYSDIRLNTGSTAKPYEPYGYKLDISSGGKNLFDKSNGSYNAYVDDAGTWRYVDTARSVKILCSANTTYTLSVPENLSVFRIYEISNALAEPPTQAAEIIRSGGINKYTFTTASTTAAIIFQGSAGDFDEWFNGLMLNSGSTPLPYEPYNRTITPVYLGDVQTTRRIKKLVLTGQEDWTRTSSTKCYYINAAKGCPIDYLKSNIITVICSHYAGQKNTSSGSNEVNEGCVCFFTGGGYELYIGERTITSATDFKSYLAAQYANGTPVTVWYVLANETTGVVNEPLRKIGDYADTVSGITIPTITGKDTFDVETTLKPSEASLSYTGWHDAYVKEKSENLWNEDYTNISSDIYYKPVYVGDYEIVTVSSTVPLTSQNFANLFALGGQQSSGASTGDNGVYSGRPMTVRPVDGYITIAYRNTNGVNPQDYDTMVNEGRTALPYEPYWE